MAKKTSATAKIAAGLGIAALTAGAAAYYLKGPDGKKHRKQLSAAGKKAKEELFKKMAGMKAFSQKAYEQAARQVMAKYTRVKNIEPYELAHIGNEFKLAWNKIAKDVVKLGANPRKKGSSSGGKKSTSKKSSKK
jgi:hypothetical protein